MRKLLTWIRRKCAYTAIDREMDPPLLLPVRFHAYEKSDFRHCLELFDLNAQDRYPADERDRYVEYLETGSPGILVGTLNGRVVSSAGLQKVGDGIFVFCYGLVHPEFQHQRIGTTMTLLRVAATVEERELIHALIFARPQAMAHYERFGFTKASTWKTSDGESCPVGLLSYYYSIALHVRSILSWREIQVRGGLKAAVNPDMVVEKKKSSQGTYSFKFNTVTVNDAVSHIPFDVSESEHI